MIHGTDDQLEAYALGQLAASDPPGLEALEEHLLFCSGCRDRLDDASAWISGMKEAFGPNSGIAISKQVDLFAWLPWPAISSVFAPAAVILLLAAIVMSSTGRTGVLPMASLELRATRGEMPLVSPARELDLTLSDSPSDRPGFRAEIVNGTGRTVWTGQALPGTRGLEVRARQNLGPGDYFLRLYAAASPAATRPLREYGFRLRIPGVSNVPR